MHRLRYFSLFVCVLAVCISARAQTGNAAISGRVVDHSGAVIQKADVSIKDLGTGTRFQSQTNDVGIYVFPSVKPGNYVMHVEKQGFRSVDVTGLTLYTQDQLARNFSLEVGSSSESITVTGGTTNDSPAVSMTVSREFVENMPLNGRSFQDLIQLAPGTVSSGTGYYSINGQRTDSNNYTVDGVSANLGGYLNSPINGNYGAGLSGASPSQTALGTTQSLASVDSLEEFTIQTSGYTAEYGRNPGGQVQFTTRSGANDIHGSLFEYLRNTAFDANTWVNNSYDEPRTAEHQNDFGGTIGGPMIIPKFYNGKDKTFYFFSYEGLRLLLPAFETEYVPTQALRNSAAPTIQPFLNVAPLPNPTSPGNKDGCTVDGTPNGPACDAQFNYSYSYPNSLDNISVRVDQNFRRRLHAFLRYADTPSSEVTGAEQVATRAINAHTWTAGFTANITNNLLDDLRFNFSHDSEKSVSSRRSIGGAVPWDRNLLIPAAYDSPYAYAYSYLSVSGTSLRANSYVGGGGSTQHQYQIVDSLTWTRTTHSFKVGADWRRLTPTFTSQPYQSYIDITSLDAIRQGYATSFETGAVTPGHPVFSNLSIYVQDHWKIRPRLSIDYGLRWEFNPPPGASDGTYPVTLSSSNLAIAQLAPSGTQPFKTNYHSFEPRFGFAWNPFDSKSYSLTVRGGFGIFFDTGQTTFAEAYDNYYPFAAFGPTLTNVPLPLSGAILAPPSTNVPLTPPYTTISTSDPNLTLPYTEQWNLSIDQALSAKNTITVSYVGNNGRKLLFTQSYQSVPGNPNFTGLNLTNNDSQSSYNALQVQDTGRIINGLDLVASFTWAHALDNASNDFSSYSPIYGNSDYDLRRVLNLALNYQTPTGRSNSWTRELTHGWLLANRFSAQSGNPAPNIIEGYVVLPDGTNSEYSPDLVPGVPIYLHGRAADLNGQPSPGGWRLNRAAFACTTTGATSGACKGKPTRQGTLGRNYVRGPSFWALNTAVQRNFPLYENLRLNFRAEAFNILNHPNFEVYDSSLSDSTFGQTVGGYSTIGSSNSLYAMGASRSLQLSLHLQF